MREPKDWKDLELADPLRLILGWRKGHDGLQARPVDLSTDVAAALRNGCTDCLASLSDLDRKVWSGVPAADSGQYLALPVTRSTDGLSTSGGLVAAEADATSQMIAIVNGAFDNDDFLSYSELKQGTWLFYAVVVQIAGTSTNLGFVRQFNPQRGLKPGRLTAAFHSTLTRFDDPLFNFDLVFDLVVGSDEVAILRGGAFERLFSDLKLAVKQVPDQVAELRKQMAVGISTPSLKVISDICGAKPALARRLGRIAQVSHLPQITKNAMGDALDRHGLPRDRFGKGAQLRITDAEDVNVFLDMVEELYFEGDFSGERRRADRYSRR